MGPETTMDPHASYNVRTSPFSDVFTKPYRLYAQELENSLDFSSLEKKKRGPAVIARLTGEPQRLPLNLSRDVKRSNNGLKKIIEKLRKFTVLQRNRISIIVTKSSALFEDPINSRFLHFLVASVHAQISSKLTKMLNCLRSFFL